MTGAETSSDKSMMPWDKIIGKKAKSNDDNELGEIKSISPDYVEIDIKGTHHHQNLNLKHKNIKRECVQSRQLTRNLCMEYLSWQKSLRPRYQSTIQALLTTYLGTKLFTKV